MLPAFNFMDQLNNYLSAVLEPPAEHWATTHEIVVESDIFRIMRFGSGGKPVLIIPPQAGHGPDIADYADGQSLVQTILKAGDYTAYVLAWKSCPFHYRHYGIDNLAGDVKYTARQIQMLSGEKPIMVGLCMGGWLLALTLALYPDLTDDLPVIAGSPINAHADRHLSVLTQILEQFPQSFFEFLVSMGGGLMRGDFMLTGWKSGHAAERYVGDYLQLWNAANDAAELQRMRRFRSWYEGTYNLAGKWYLWAIKHIFRNNDLWEGRCRVYGRTVNLQSVEAISIAGLRDDISPPASALALAGPHYEIDKGHIGLFMSTGAQKTWYDIFSSAMWE